MYKRNQNLCIPERNARQDIHRQAAERLALMGRAVFVSQSLSGLRSSQSQPYGCFQRSGFAAGEPARSAISVLGGFATSSAPAFPSSCAAASQPLPIITLNQSQLLSGIDSNSSQPKSGNDILDKLEFSLLLVNINSVEIQF